MSSRARRAFVAMVVSACLGLLAAPAAAQIYAIRDENGVLTLSDKPLGEGAQTFAVRGASTVRATRGEVEGVRTSQWDDVIDFRAREQGIRPDLEDRPQKSPRACVIASDPPRVVHLITRAQGGLHDYEAFLHEAGHALHYAGCDPSLPLAFRRLGRDHALTEIYSFLLDSISQEPGWHAEHFGLTVPFTGYALRALRTAKRVRSRGNTRGTRYYAA